MSLSPSLFMLMRFLFLLSLFFLISSRQPLCHDVESFALLQFKESFIFNQSASNDPSAYSKVSSWMIRSNDCCTWDGVESDENTGHVISLDLSSSYLYGSINSSSSLFQLVHLQRLNLVDNHFNNSEIPIGVRQLSNLTHLNVSYSGFSGKIPAEILQLSKLVSLSLGPNPLELHKPGLRSIAEKLTNLEELVLSEVDISSTVPSILANLSSLTTIFLRDCGSHGEFPTGIFQLPNLKSLSVRFNPKLIGRVPEFNRSSPLEYLRLEGASFSGKLLDSMGNLQSLYELEVRSCNFSRPIPSSFANLTKLAFLDLSKNIFSRGTLSWVGKQAKLTTLCLENISLYGDIPFSSNGNLTKLTTLILDRNELTGPTASWLTTLTQLNTFTVSYNKLCSPIPTSTSSLLNLQILDLSLNNLSGTVAFDLFQKLNNLSHLDLSYNNLLLVIDPSTNSTFQKFRILGLGFCNLSDFPEFLQNEDQLEVLELSLNNIHGHIPKWISNMIKDSLEVLEMSDNLLTGFDHIPDALIWTNLQILILPNNKLQGSLPIPPPSILDYSVSNNMLTGDISQKICELSSLSYLNVSYNNLSDFLPHCLGDLRNLSILNLQYNNIHGSIPQIFTEGCKLGMITLSQNRFEGPLPRSLANCTTLEVFDIGNNHIIDFFPSWSGILPELRVLILQSNGLYGFIGKPETISRFPKLQVIDVSNNNVSGKLPSEYFQIWKAMQSFDASHLTYMQTDGQALKTQSNGWLIMCIYSMTLTNKGIKTKYSRIQDFFVAIDLSV